MSKFSELLAEESKPTFRITDGDDGSKTIASDFVDSREVPKDPEAFIAYWGYDPKVWQLVGNKIGGWTKQQKDGSTLASYQFTVELIVRGDVVVEFAELAEFWKSAIRPDRRRYSKKKSGRTAFVVARSDEQLGKVDVGGGTKETLQRLDDLLDLALAEAERVKPDLIVLPHGGDLTEGCNNTTAQRATNDMDPIAQGEEGSMYHSKWIEAFSSIAPIVTGGCGSNHDQDRIGKGLAGKPSADKGLSALRLAVWHAKRAGLDVELFEPENDFLEWNILPVLGWKIGLIHGHQVRGGSKGIKDYFFKHIQFNSSLSEADVLIVAHNHEEYDLMIGRGSAGNARKAIGLAPLDNGSGWFTNLAAATSDPGITTFVIEEETGLDMTTIKRWHRDEDIQRRAASWARKSIS